MEMSKIVTIFKNIKETNTPFHKDVLFILDRIKNGTNKELIKKIFKYKYAEALNAAQQMLTEAGKITAVWTKLDKNTSKTDINRRAQKTIIRIIISALHDAMKIALKDEKTIINFDQPKDIKKLADLFTPEQLAEKIEFCYQKIRSIDASVNETLIFEHLLLNLKSFDTMKV